MARRLAGYVHLTDPDTGQPVVLAPGDDVPGWADELITNPAAWADDDEQPAAPSRSPQPKAAGRSEKKS
ncbi:hypothetical protein GCM10023201_40990 [Actinomycetospora corticicola]|uniref:Uncharacterized protein n=1 Tax=Actinomycetospora corticicola TaxID=663602 RepID=A0A7Y9J694_9PSEU|nr:hypothetical protein [Actinomycetospora corticicola]NYD36816.1 hypothetical protein [Actinomycetospora corticicola]